MSVAIVNHPDGNTVGVSILPEDGGERVVFSTSHAGAIELLDTLAKAVDEGKIKWPPSPALTFKNFRNPFATVDRNNRSTLLTLGDDELGAHQARQLIPWLQAHLEYGTFDE